MNVRVTLCIGIAICMLTACSDKNKIKQLSCDNPEFLEQTQQQLNQLIQSNARQFIQSDHRNFVDIDKIIAASSQLTMTLENQQLNTQDADHPNCTAQLTVTVPPQIWEVAQTNTPLLFTLNNLPSILNQSLVNTSVQLVNNIFQQSITYQPVNTSKNQSEENNISDNDFSALSRGLSQALLPYAVKDIIIINNKPYSRAEALALMNQPTTTLTPDAIMASDILNGNANITPIPTNTPSVSKTDLQDAQDNDRNATNQINQVWNNLDPTVQKQLSSEQKKWINNKASQCAREANHANNQIDGEMMRLSCNTRLTNQRIKYLRGFSIN